MQNDVAARVAVNVLRANIPLVYQVLHQRLVTSDAFDNQARLRLGRDRLGGLFRFLRFLFFFGQLLGGPAGRFGLILR